MAYFAIHMQGTIEERLNDFSTPLSPLEVIHSKLNVNSHHLQFKSETYKN